MEQSEIIENKLYTIYPSDVIGYFTPTAMTQIRTEELRYYKFLKRVYRRYKARYRHYGRFMVFVSQDQKHWMKAVDRVIPK